MVEGERPESSGAHNWNRESAAETAKRQRGEQAREQAEVIQRYRKTDIDRHIAGLRQQVDTPLYDLAAAPSAIDHDKQERANAKHKLRYEQQAGVYTHTKDTYKAKTVVDVEDKLRQHEVDPAVGRLWSSFWRATANLALSNRFFCSVVIRISDTISVPKLIKFIK